MDLNVIPKDKRMYMTYRKNNPHVFTETNDLACLIKDIIQYPIGNVADDTESPGTLFIGNKRYASIDAYRVLEQILIIACQHRRKLNVLLYDDFEPNEDLLLKEETQLQQCDQECKKLGILKKDVISCLETFDAFFARYQLTRPREERDHVFLHSYLDRIRGCT